MSMTEMHRQSAELTADRGRQRSDSRSRRLRGWLDHLAAHDRLAVIQPGTRLQFELAAIAKRFDGIKATLFPHPGGHSIPVISGLVSDRTWIAEAMGVEPANVLARFQDAALNPLPWKEVKSAPVQEVVHRNVDLEKQLPLPVHNEHDNGAYITAGLLIARNPITGIQNVSIHRLQVSGPDRLGALLVAAPYPHVLRGGRGGRTTARCRHRGRCRSADAVVVAGDRARSTSTNSPSPARCMARRFRW